MATREEDREFLRYRESADPQAMARVFDLTASRLLLLAMHLVRDASQAEDLVQTTFLQAIQDADRFEASRPLMPWLVGILTHRARDVQRQLQRRREHAESDEQRTRDPRPGPLEQLQGRETLEHVARALDGVPGRYRHVLILRLVHGLRAVQIAHSLDRSPETVRTQLRRGLELLRERLPKSLVVPSMFALFAGEGLAAVRAQVVKAAALSKNIVPVAGTAAAVLGVVVMKKFVLGSLVAAGLVLFGYVGWEWMGSDAGIGAEKAPTESVGRARGGAASTSAEDTKKAPEEQAVQRQRLASEVQPEQPLAADEIRFIGRCVDAETGAPVAGCKVTLYGGPANEQRTEAYKKPIHFQKPEPQTTIADGRFSFQFKPPPPYQFILDIVPGNYVKMRGSWSSLEAGLGKTVDLGDISLTEGCRVSGQVVDTKGVPQEGVRVSIMQGGFGNPGQQPRMPGWGEVGPAFYDSATSTAHGVLQFKPLPPGEWNVTVSNRELPQLVKPRRFTIRPDQKTATLEVVIRAEDEIETISGVVVDQRGTPVAGASVDTVPTPQVWPRRIASTQKDGSFQLPRLRKAHGDKVRLQVYDAGGRGDFEDHVTDEEYSWGATGVRVVVRRMASVEVVVVDAAGKPVEDYGVRVFLDPMQGKSSSAHLQARGHHPGGKVEIPGVHHGRNFLMVEPMGEDLQPSWLKTFDMTETGAPPQRVELQEAVQRELKVVFADGRPVAGTRVELVREIYGRPVLVATTVLLRSQMNRLMGPLNVVMPPEQEAKYLRELTQAILLQKGATDTMGRLVLAGAPAEGLSLRVLGPGHQPHVVNGITLAPGQGTLRVEVPVGATLVGSLKPDGAVASLQPPAEKVAQQQQHPGGEKYVANLRPGLRLVDRVGGRQFPGAFEAHAVVKKDGTFTVRGIPPGSWRIILSCHAGSMEVGQVSNLKEGETRRLDLDAGGLLPGELSGKVFLDGNPVADTPFRLFGMQPDRTWSGYLVNGRTDANGAFQLTARQAAYRLEVDVKSEDWKAPRKMKSSDMVRVVAGQTTEHVFQLTRVKVRIRVLYADGKTPLADRELTINARMMFQTTVLKTDAQGWLVLDPAPPGEIKLEAWPPELNSQQARMERMKEPHQPGTGFTASWERLKDACTELPPLQVPAGKTDVQLEVRLPRGFR